MRKTGFTLIEVLMAMLILSSAVVLLASSWSGSFARIRKTQLKTEVNALLQRKMAEIDLKYRGKPLESIQDAEEDFGSEYPQYRWKLKVKDFVFPDLTPLLTAREGGANEKLLQIMKMFSDHMSKSVKEVKVSVIYKSTGGQENEYSVTTYYVDYDKEIPIPGLPASSSSSASGGAGAGTSATTGATGGP